MRRFVYAAVLILVASLLAAPPLSAGSAQTKVNANASNVAIRGYDTVAYFTEGKPTKGKPEHVFFWNEAEWYFNSATHRDMFAASPERYAPQFGGFCSVAMSNGVMVAANPEVWTIVDGKLYLKVTERGRDMFRRNARKYIREAEQNWAELLQKQD